MKKNISLAFVLVAGMLAGCGKQFQLSPVLDDSSSALAVPVDVKPKSAAATMIADLESNLRGVRVVGSTQSKLQVKASAKALAISDSEIAVILSTVTMALENSNLMSSNDLSSIIPVLVQGASLGIGTLQSTDKNQLSNLLAAVGNSAINSIVNMSDSGVSTSLLQDLANSLFKGFSSSGVSKANISGVANSVIASLLGRLSESDLAASGFDTVLKSLASGAVTGLGQLNLGSTLFSTVLNSLGSGSFSGIGNLVTSVLGAGANTNSGANWMSTLLNSFTSGIQGGLGGVQQSGATGGGIAGLLSSFLSGVSGSTNQAPGATPGLGSGTLLTVVSGLLRLWL